MSKEHKSLQAEEGLDAASVDVDDKANKIGEGTTASAEEDAEKAAAALEVSYNLITLLQR